MILVAYRVGPDVPWSVYRARSHAIGLACSHALFGAGFRTHVFDRDSLEHLRATHDGFDDAQAARQFPVRVPPALIDLCVQNYGTKEEREKVRSSSFALFGEGRF